MPTTPKTYDMGACDVYWNDTKLGYTSGGVILKASVETQEIEVDQEQDAIDEVITKRTITADVPLVDFTLENLQMAFIGSEIVTASGGAKKLVVKSASGKSAKDGVGVLKLHPLTATGPEDKTKDVTFPAGAPLVTDLEISYTKDGLKTIPVTFKAYPDESGETMIVGDKAIVAGA